MNVGSLFSGIGGMDAGLARAGHEHVFFCEADPYRREVLAARWPGVPVYEDVRTLGKPAARTETDGRGTEPVEGGREAGAGLLGCGDLGLLCGGFPCQDLSVAGRRRGLDGERSGLFFEFARLIDAFRPGWVLVENVPGLLSSNGGRDFGVVLGTLADLGYGVAWRVLDSRFFGVPQRRRRVFIVGAKSVGDPRAAAERAGQILAVGTRCPGHPATRGEARQDVAGTLGGGAGERGWPQDVERMTFPPVANTLRENERNTSQGPGNYAPAYAIQERAVSENPDAGPQGAGWKEEEAYTLEARHHVQMVAMNLRGREGGAMPELDNVASLRAAEGGSSRSYVAAPLTKGSATGEGVNPPGRRQEDDVNIVAFHATQDPISGEQAPAMGKGNKQGCATIGVSDGVGVRRLTPTECERLQGLPDGWTQLGGTPDSRRYSALGDAVTATVAEWLGQRIEAA